MEEGRREGENGRVKKKEKDEKGKRGVERIDENEEMVKRMRRKGKKRALESANKNHETKIFGPDRVKVQGVLV